MRRSQSKLKTSIALAAALIIAAGSVAEARPGGGRSMGSRGSNSYSAPPATSTAPRQAQPLPGSNYSTPSAPMSAPARQGSRFGGGLMGGLAAGFLGAGLFGMLTGSGFLSGMGSFLGLLGFLAQAALVAMVVMFAINWFRRRNQPAMASGPQSGAQPMFRQPEPSAAPMGGAAAAGFGARPAPAPTQPLSLVDADFGRFEEILGEVQTAYGRGDLHALAQVTTPEIANQLGDEIEENARRGVINKVTSPKLLQGDLSEAWSEQGLDYGTVAMRFSVIDVTLDKATGRVVGGDQMRPTEATEIWTFVRKQGSGQQGWALSAIQQA